MGCDRLRREKGNAVDLALADESGGMHEHDLAFVVREIAGERSG